MRLDRNTTKDGSGKYALVRMDKIREFPQTSIRTPDIQRALAILQMYGVLEWGEKGSPEEFFVIKLKDKKAPFALRSYAMQWKEEDMAFCQDVYDLVDRSEEIINQPPLENRKDL